MPTSQVAIIAVAAVLITLIWACVKLGKTTSGSSDDTTAAPQCISSHCVEGDHVYNLGPAGGTKES